MRENCEKLMQADENLDIIPGGGREICKRKGEAYKLLWKKRSGLVEKVPTPEHGNQREM